MRVSKSGELIVERVSQELQSQQHRITKSGSEFLHFHGENMASGFNAKEALLKQIKNKKQRIQTLAWKNDIASHQYKNLYPNKKKLRKNWSMANMHIPKEVLEKQREASAPEYKDWQGLMVPVKEEKVRKKKETSSPFSSFLRTSRSVADKRNVPLIRPGITTFQESQCSISE